MPCPAHPPWSLADVWDMGELPIRHDWRVGLGTKADGEVVSVSARRTLSLVLCAIGLAVLLAGRWRVTGAGMCDGLPLTIDWINDARVVTAPLFFGAAGVVWFGAHSVRVVGAHLVAFSGLVAMNWFWGRNLVSPPQVTQFQGVCDNIPALALLPRAALAAPDGVDPAAQVWLNAADDEASAAATFHRVALDLERMGAPCDLTQRVHAASDDEQRHARLCTDIAQDFGATAQAPLPPERDVRWSTPGELAAMLFAGSVVNEGACVRWLAAAAEAAPEPLRGTLDQFVEEERHHVALSRDVVAWCLEVDPASTMAALAQARAALPDRLRQDPAMRAVPRRRRAAVGVASDRCLQRAWIAACRDADMWLDAEKERLGTVPKRSF